MSDTMRAILIDPVAKTVTEVQAEPYPKWKELIDADDINSVKLAENEDGTDETLWVDGEFLLNEKSKGPWFQFDIHDQPMGGKGIILGTDQYGETCASKMTVEFVTEHVRWPDVEFTGIKYEEPEMVDHPVLGETVVHRQTAQFKERDRDEEDQQGEERTEGRNRPDVD